MDKILIIICMVIGSIYFLMSFSTGIGNNSHQWAGKYAYSSLGFFAVSAAVYLLTT